MYVYCKYVVLHNRCYSLCLYVCGGLRGAIGGCNVDHKGVGVHVQWVVVGTVCLGGSVNLLFDYCIQSFPLEFENQLKGLIKPFEI